MCSCSTDMTWYLLDVSCILELLRNRKILTHLRKIYAPTRNTIDDAAVVHPARVSVDILSDTGELF